MTNLSGRHPHLLDQILSTRASRASLTTRSSGRGSWRRPLTKSKHERWVLSSVDHFVWAETHLRLIHLYWLQIFLSVASSSSAGEIRWWIFQIFCRVSHPNSQTWSWLRAERQWAWTWRAEMGLTKENVIDESFKKNHAATALRWEVRTWSIVCGCWQTICVSFFFLFVKMYKAVMFLFLTLWMNACPACVQHRQIVRYSLLKPVDNNPYLVVPVEPPHTHTF